MLEGLFISLVGMGAVFVSLTIIMFLMMGIERVFRSEGMAIEGMLAVGEMIAEAGVVTGGEKPGGTAEVAAITLALARHVKERGKELGTSITINDVNYQVEVGDISGSPTSVAVNGESFWGAVDGAGLPFAKQTGIKITTQERSPQRERVWRTAYPPLQGGDYWCRRGWTGR
jgi:Na+-transporting methylmalonyl-CoA/oxaloacetate decarboxylase gamma subunit